MTSHPAPPDAEGTRETAGPRPGASEEHVPHARLWTGRLLGPALGVLVYLASSQDPALSTDAAMTLGVAVLIAVWWMTEALPLAVTSLMPLLLFPALGIFDIDQATSQYGDKIVFLFLGGFIIALAMEKWNLHKRIALLTMSAIGSKPRQLLLGIMIATWFLSMWVSNTATTMMMLPIGVSVLTMVAGEKLSHLPADRRPTDEDDPVTALSGDRDTRNFAISVMLGIAFAATIGGLGTLIGSPPNLVMVGVLEDQFDTTVSFADWMKLGVPLSLVFLVVAWLMLSRVIFPTTMKDAMGGRDVVREELRTLGRMSRGEWSVLAVFVSTALLWIFLGQLQSIDWLVAALPFVAGLNDTSVAMAAAVALFLIPVSAKDGVQAMDWKTAQRGVPWGVLLLFGGGLCLAAAMSETGVSDWIGQRMEGLGVLPTVLLVAAVCLLTLLLTELTSNTATSTTFLPVFAGFAVAIGVDPMLLMVPAAMAATCSFMLPVGTPPNAIVYGSGYVTMPQMVKAGVWLNLIGVVLITGMTMLLGGWAMGLEV
ncbi:DASS family sodium-coupled anion symporter [Nesterenkonia sp. F]|uniref:SLC13 family permease n=1 Tax=Nesterenkonia sp. F TaxID=795955 RepID=UPI00049698FD|nr:DASS family sodium-coupled anion symporter [Nesterenkonia sp. F]